MCQSSATFRNECCDPVTANKASTWPADSNGLFRQMPPQTPPTDSLPDGTLSATIPAQPGRKRSVASHLLGIRAEHWFGHVGTQGMARRIVKPITLLGSSLISRVCRITKPPAENQL